MSMTATSTRTLVVNPAFLQEIKDSNPDFWHSVHELRQTCESEEDSIQVSKRLVRQLDNLRDALAFQFALEESYGFISVPSSLAMPQAQELADLAHGQHCSLYLRLSELAEQAEEFQYRGVAALRLGDLIAGALAFDAALREHERLEANLIEQAFDGLQNR